ncbi:MAG: Na/Pi cotransporter family protein [Deltaproteobacteria bacterium]|nr:MAG: Na/Pi cotransporter family protein [Deltaproteobacteria bacterium]
MLTLLLDQHLIFGLLGGLGLFLYGMRILSTGLQKLSGTKLRQILAALTNNRVVGALVGALVTVAVQSSSASSVMLVGLVNAGLVTLVQAVGVLVGINVGTTLTVQLLAFPLTGWALPAIGVGALVALVSRHRKYTYYGEVLLGIGLVFFGLGLMKQAFDPVRGSAEVVHFLTLVGDNRLLAVAVGALLTMMVQSSTAIIGLTLVLASSGLLDFQACVALVLGENIGTTVTANIAALGAGVDARRTALAHSLFNVFGVVVMLLLFPFFTSLVDWLTPGDPDFSIRTAEQAAFFAAALGDKPFIARHVANAHTLFNLLNALIFLPLVKPLARLVCLMMPGEQSRNDLQVRFIDQRVLETPPIAIGQARMETRRMGQVVREMLADTLEYQQDLDERRVDTILHREEILDLLQHDITDFLVSLSQRSVSQQTSTQIARLLNVVNDLERIGDLCIHLLQLHRRRLREKIVFSETATEELSDMARKVRLFVGNVLDQFDLNGQADLSGLSEARREIEQMEDDLRRNHIQRLNTGECAVQPGLLFIEAVQGLEKIADHASKIARSLQIHG